MFQRFVTLLLIILFTACSMPGGQPNVTGNAPDLSNPVESPANNADDSAPGSSAPNILPTQPNLEQPSEAPISVPGNAVIVVTPAAPSTGENPMPDWMPAPEDEKLRRGQVFLDTSEILLLESFPPQIMLKLTGSLPTPCHKLRVRIAEPDAKNRIQIEVYSIFNPKEMCIQVLQELDTSIHIPNPPAGKTYTIFVNGKSAGEVRL